MIRSIAKQIVNRLLAKCGALLTSAIIVVVHALRLNPDKYAIIFDNAKYNDNNNEYLEALREVASSCLKILVKDLTEKTMVYAVKEQ
jgi:hypothetical protein